MTAEPLPDGAMVRASGAYSLDGTILWRCDERCQEHGDALYRVRIADGQNLDGCEVQWCASVLTLLAVPIDPPEKPSQAVITDPLTYHRLRCREAMGWQDYPQPNDAIHNLETVIEEMQAKPEGDKVQINTLLRVRAQLYTLRALVADAMVDCE